MSHLNMNELKSKLPDLNELGSMVNKLFHDVKTSVSEIVDDYKKKHPSDTTSSEPSSEPPPIDKTDESIKKD